VHKKKHGNNKKFRKKAGFPDHVKNLH
jgi:hypothetical protein